MLHPYLALHAEILGGRHAKRVAMFADIEKRKK